MVADTYSTDGIGVLLMGTGNDNNTWGSNANASVFQILSDAVTGFLSSAVTGGSLDLSGSPPPAASSQVRYAVLIFTGTLLSNETVTVPALHKLWRVSNQTSGAFTLSMKTPTSSAVVIPQNSGHQTVRVGTTGATITVDPFNTTQIQMPDGSLSAPPYSNVNETNSGWYRFGTQDWRLVIGGAAVLQATGAGAATPSIINVLSPNAFQLQGVQSPPAGTEIEGAWIEIPTGYLATNGASYLRSAQPNLFAAISKVCTGNTHTSTLLDNLSVDLRNKGLEGAVVEGTGIPSGTTIIAGSITASQLTLSAAATSTTVGVSLTIIPYGAADSTHFNVPDRRGRFTACRDDIGGTPASRITVAGSGINGKSLIGAGGAETVTLTSATTPVHSHTLVAAGTSSSGGSHAHSDNEPAGSSGVQAGGSFLALVGVNAASTGSTSIAHTHNVTGSTDNSGSGGAHQNMPPFGITNRAIKT